PCRRSRCPRTLLCVRARRPERSQPPPYESLSMNTLAQLFGKSVGMRQERPVVGKKAQPEGSGGGLIGFLSLEELDRGLFRGWCHDGIPLRAFGGQVAGQ